MIRKEEEQDLKAVKELNLSAFETSSEAELVDVLRRSAEPLVSLVFEDSEQILGHIMFSPVTIEGLEDKILMGLAPMAVAPEYQRKGIGSKLVEVGLDICKEIDCGAVVVLGHPEYYPKFGFKPSVEFNFKSEYDVPNEAFMALELIPAYLSKASGIARYHEAFRTIQ